MLTATEYKPRALFGGELRGEYPVRYVYVDEAGTSVNDPVVVVCGVIIHPDAHWRLTEAEINRVLDRHVPARLRDGFVFHAKEVFSGGKNIDRTQWVLEDRLRFFQDFVSIPSRLNLPVAIGIVHKEGFAVEVMDGGVRHPPLSVSEFAHMMAFAVCLQTADYQLRETTLPVDVATVVAEDLPRMKRFLDMALPELKVGALHDLRVDGFEVMNQGIERIIDCVHFAGKRGALMLQLADACAFAWRRHLSGMPYADVLMEAMLGGPIRDEDRQADCISGKILRFASAC